MRKKLLDRDSDEEEIWEEGGEFYGEGIFQYEFDAIGRGERGGGERELQTRLLTELLLLKVLKA